jgi:hypothetical protein
MVSTASKYRRSLADATQHRTQVFQIQILLFIQDERTRTTNRGGAAVYFFDPDSIAA